MSAEQRPTPRSPSSQVRPPDGERDGEPAETTTAHAERRTAAEVTVAPEPACSSSRERPDTLAGSAGRVPAGCQVLPHRIERTQLEATIAALERELVASERRRQHVIDQYERVLERRENEDTDTTATTKTTSAQEGTVLRRLLDFGRR